MFMIMKKSYLLAMAMAAMVSCSSDEFVGDNGSPNGVNGNGGEKSISFNYELQKVTRGESDHETSAANLGNQFIVWGEKSSGATDTKDAPADGHIVFPNYQVNYDANTANNTTSNTKDWEYVGYTHTDNYQNNITYKASASTAEPGSSVAQTIKYWDYSAGSYTFTAVSASKLDGSNKTDIENGYVKIQKNIDDNDKASEKGYTVTVTGNADLTKLYFSDRLVITKTAGTDRTATNAYGGNVTLKFRNALSQVRVGVYETLSGYDISDIHFYVTNDAEAKVSTVDAFGAICPNIKGQGYAGNLTVTYSEETATLNQPVVSASGTVATDLILGTNTSTITTSKLLGKTATDPTWDTDGGTFTTVMLQAAHTTNMKVKCDYTLYNSVSHETIEVKGATAEVPYQYLQWKPNFKYTYLFKISDNSNGSTGEGVVGLYPITFDAIEITNSDGVAEYITTVSEPSITTFGVKNSKYTTGKDEYETGTDIYATFVKGSTVLTPQLTTENATNYVQIYQVTTSDAANFPITEASVAERLAETPAGTAKITCTNISASTSTNYFADSTAPSVVSEVPAEDGTTKTIAAVKLDNVKTNTYAIEIVTYEAVTLTNGAALNGYYLIEGDTYTKQTSGEYSSGTYYKQIKTYKIIKVVAGS